MANAEYSVRLGERLALFFDGTWNVAKNDMNVWWLRLMLAECDSNGLFSSQAEPFLISSTDWAKKSDILGGAESLHSYPRSLSRHTLIEKAVYAVFDDYGSIDLVARSSVTPYLS